MIAVAATKQRWAEVDEATDDPLTVAEGLLMATHSLTFPLQKRDATDAHRAFVSEIARRISLLRTGLRKKDLADVDAQLEGQATKVGIRLASAPDVATLVDQLLAAPPKKIRGLKARLLERLRENPAIAKQLPAIEDVMNPGARIAIADLHLLALQPSGDVEAMRAHFATLRELGLSITAALSTLANSSKFSRTPYLLLVAPLLDDADADVRWWAFYFLRHAAREDATELADWAEPIARRIADSTRLPGSIETVGVEARRVLGFALAATKRRGDFVRAAKTVIENADPKMRATLRKHLREVLPEALE